MTALVWGAAILVWALVGWVCFDNAADWFSGQG